MAHQGSWEPPRAVRPASRDSRAGKTGSMISPVTGGLIGDVSEDIWLIAYAGVLREHVLVDQFEPFGDLRRR
jgi:hypothetical protein